jgi:hypothetical protein
MRIVGEWRLADDGVTRPFVEADVQAADGGMLPEIFLIDCGADRTVFSESFLRKGAVIFTLWTGIRGLG